MNSNIILQSYKSYSHGYLAPDTKKHRFNMLRNLDKAPCLGDRYKYCSSVVLVNYSQVFVTERLGPGQLFLKVTTLEELMFSDYLYSQTISCLLYLNAGRAAVSLGQAPVTEGWSIILTFGRMANRTSQGSSFNRVGKVLLTLTESIK